jgi:cell division protein ZapA
MKSLVADKQTVTIELAGARYRMTSDAEAEHLHRLAALVNDRIDALGSKAVRNASPAQLLAVVALGLADDLLAEETRRKTVESITRHAIGDAIERIDSRLAVEAQGAGRDGA